MAGSARDARTVGVLYMLLGAIAPVRLLYFQGRIFVPGDTEHPCTT